MYIFLKLPALAKASSAMANTETYTQRGEALRARGNVLYREVSSAGVGGDASSKRDKLSRAQKYYEEALESCSSSEERASCCKNLGALHYLWGKVELESVPSWKPAAGGGSAASTLTACKEHLANSVSFFINAKVEGARAKKPKEWMDHADASLLGMVNWAAEQSRILDLSGAPILRDLCENFDRFTRKGSVKSAAGALANVELTESLSAQDNLSEALSSQCEQSLERASHLLEGLPSTATNNDLSQRISKLRMGLQWRNVFFGKHAVFCN